MEGTHATTTTPTSQSKPSPLAQLRLLAQQNLQEIESEKAEEVTQQSRAVADVDRYAKTRQPKDRLVKILKDQESMSRKQSRARASASNAKRSPSPISAAHLTRSPSNGVNTSQSDEEKETKKAGLRPAHEVLQRLKWDSRYQLSEYTVGYLERFDGILEMPADRWMELRDVSDEDFIPWHRVRYVKRIYKSDEAVDEGPEEGVVWSRDDRLDLIFCKEESAEGPGTVAESVDGTSVSGGVSL